MNKIEMKKLLEDCFEDYNTNLFNKTFIVFYGSGPIYDKIEVSFTKANFKHLTGVIYNKRDPKELFNDLKRNTLKIELLEEQHYTFLKLRKMSTLSNIFFGRSAIGDYNNHRVDLETDKVVGLSSGYSCLAITKKSERYYAPNSFIDSDIKQEVYNQERVQLVLSRRIQEKLYNLVCSKNGASFDKAKLTINNIDLIESSIISSL